MRSSSIFHDEKLLLSLPNTLETSQHLTLSRKTLSPKPLNFPRLFVACSTNPNLKNSCNNFPNFALLTTVTRGQSATIFKSKEIDAVKTSRVSLIFTSLEVENLYSAFHLFLVFLSRYIDKLLKSKFLKLTSPLPYGKARVTSSQITNFGDHFAYPTYVTRKLPTYKGAKFRNLYEIVEDSIKHVPTTLPMGNVSTKHCLSAKQGHHIFSKVALSTSRYGEDYKLRNLALKTVRNLAQSLSALGVPQKANLYTVIRSPHVFKKTREQFVKQKYKLRIQLDFASNTLSSEFLDALVLLKLPAEIKVVIHSRL